MSLELRSSDGVNLTAEAAGPENAPAILFLNSIGCTRSMWDAQAEALSEQFFVIRFDTRGHGQSDAPAGDYTLDRLGRDALDVLDAFRVERANLCGLSLGGVVAQWVSINAAHRVERLIVANTSSRVGSYEAWEARRNLVLGEGLEAIADMAMERFFSPAFREARPDVVTGFKRGLLDCPPHGYAGCCAALRDADLTESLASISAPTLVIGGSEDISTTPSQTLELAHAVKGAQYELLPAGHLSNVEVPAEFTRVIRKHLESANG